MEENQDLSFKMLQEFLLPSEISDIPNAVLNKIEVFFNQKFEEFITAKAVFEVNRKNLDEKLEDLTKNFVIAKEDLAKYEKDLDSHQKYTTAVEEQLNDNRTELSRLQECVKRLEKENFDVRKQKDEIEDENNLLHLQIERKNSELDCLKKELPSLYSQLQNAVSAKCQALAKVEEVKSQEISLEFREKRMEQERLLLSQQVSGLEEELSKRTTELQNARSEASSRALITYTKLTHCEEELKIANESITQLRESNSNLQSRCESLTQKIEEQRTHELTMHASYQEEITAQTRLANLYKGMLEEANLKAEDYGAAVKELQTLLEHATEQYGIIESKLNQNFVEHKREITEKQKKTDELIKELDNANELIKTIKQEQLDQTVERLAPTAAVASKILKKGLSLTQIYTQLVDATNDLCSEKEENVKLKTQMEIILRELEEKAPILNRQREEYEVALANVTTLTLKIDELIAENNCLQENASEATRLANYNAKENQRLKSELADLARQVCYLLKEVQETRTGVVISTNEIHSIDTDNLVSSQIISKKLVTFKDILELQENNQKLLSIVRTLSARQEEIDKTTDQINSGELKIQLDRCTLQLSDMQAAQDRQAKMLENLIKQRDLYKNLYQQHVTRSSQDNIEDKCSNVLDPSERKAEISKEKYESDKILETKLKDTETKLNQVNNDFEIYKKEKLSYEQMLNDEIERLRKDSEKNSTQCCKLKAQLDSTNERFKLLQDNVLSYKSQIKILEEKCNNYSITIGKHEQSLMLLKNETLAAQSNLSKAEVQLENLRQERQLLRDSEGRLLKEQEVLLRERQTHALLKADVEVIKASLERINAESQLRTEERLDDATRECAALRRRLQEEQDRFRELSLHLERQNASIQERLKDEKNIAERIQHELDASRTNEQLHLKKIEELNMQLQQTTNTSKTIAGDNNYTKKIKELELQLSTNLVEIKSLSDQLKAARFQGQQYCDIAESAESQLRDSMDHFNKTKEELENNLQLAQEEISVLKEKIKEHEHTISSMSNIRGNDDIEANNKLAQAEQDLEELNRIKKELKSVQIDLNIAISAATTAEEKYTREMTLHSADLQILSHLKEENQIISSKISELIQQRDSAKETLYVEKSMWQDREKSLNNEIINLQKRVDDLNAQNIILHDQIQHLSEQAAISHCKQTDLNEKSSLNKSVELVNRNLNEEDVKSVDQLLQIIKYLRREKDLTIAKFDVVKTENTRLKSQLELTNKRLNEMKSLVEKERENTEIDILTVSKHAELLRKVETLNAITDSNRTLREERDTLLNKINILNDEVTKLSAEVLPLREKSRDLELKIESLQQENSSLKGEALRWRQRANILVERSNKASPEDWRRLQTERENLSKLLTSERETYAKCTDELNNIKGEKSRLEEQFKQMQRQLQLKEEQIISMTEDTRKLNQDLNNYISELNVKAKDLTNLKKNLDEKDAILADIKNKEIQIRKIAKKYKTQYEELAKNLDEEKSRSAGSQSTQTPDSKCSNEEDQQSHRNRENELTLKLDELNQQISSLQTESENLKKEIDTINKTSLEKEERAKQVLKGARTKIMQLTEYKKLCEKEMIELKEKLDSNTCECESNVNEYEARLAALKSQMESRISRLEHERSELQAEKETLLQRAAQLQRQLTGQNNINTSNNEPPTANIKPMSARTETPLASIRPMSVVVQSRTAAVLPTTAGAPLLLAAQQQIVHTTETSSPTSSHSDYQPASTSRQLLVQPQLSESAESTQREESEILEPLNTQQQQQQQQQQCQQQAIALVSPRVEQQQNPQQQSLLIEQQTVPSSSTQSVSTSHASGGHKRPRTLESTTIPSTINENIDSNRQEQSLSPKSKKKRQDLASTPISVSDIEYQVPTSSQRDQDEEGEEGCVVVDCDEGEPHHRQEEEFDNDPYEEIEEDEELPYGVEVEGDNNEVEIIIEDEAANVEVSRQIQTGISNNQQQQSEAISSAGTISESSTFSSRSSRSIPPMPRQQQHLVLPQQGYEDVGDDCIVPSTPTLFVPRRNDGFGEAINSPQVPQGRFTFGDTSTPISTSISQTLTNCSNGRTIYASSGLAQVVQEGMDDTRVDLTQLDEGHAGRSGVTAPHLMSVCESLDKQENMTASTDSQLNVNQSSNSNIILNIHASAEKQENESKSFIPTTETNEDNNDNVNTEASGLAMGDEEIVDAEVEIAEETTDETVDEEETKDSSREAEASPSSNTRQRSTTATIPGNSSNVLSPVRGVASRRTGRAAFRASRGTRLTPIVWDNQSSSRGQSVMRSHSVRGATNESIRARSTRGRRVRSKYPYNY